MEHFKEMDTNVFYALISEYEYSLISEYNR